MGRSAKAEAEHRLNGTPVKISGVSAVAPGRPKFPRHLCAAAKTEFKRVCQLLEARGTLTTGDCSVLSIYAEIFSRWVEAKREIAEQGLMVTIIVTDNHGVPHEKRVKNPCLDIAVACERQILALVKELGLSPIAKDKAKSARPPEVDPMEDFLDHEPGPVLMIPKRHEETN